ncbi:hypothetical protein ACFQX7_32715 [Luedemannella flava]
MSATPTITVDTDGRSANTARRATAPPLPVQKIAHIRTWPA